MNLVKRTPDGISVFALRAGFLGDVLMSTAAVRAVRSAYPDSTIVYATWDISKSLLECNPDIDHVVPVGSYRLGDFDTLVDVRHEKLMDEHAKANGGKFPPEYWGELHFRQFARELSGLTPPVDYRPVIYLKPEDYHFERGSSRKLAVINVWSKNGVNWRLWSIDKWAYIVERLQAHDIAVIQLGGRDDPPVPNVNLFLNDLPLRRSVGVMCMADYVIGIDSFVMHVASSRIYDADSGQLVKDGVPGCLLAGPIAPSNVIPVGSPVVPYRAAELFCPDGEPCGTSFATEELPFCKYRNACMHQLGADSLWLWLVKTSLMN